jgi:hypothetical protein
MYSYLEIEFIWKNVNTWEEWDLVCNTFSWLFDDIEVSSCYDEYRQQHFQETSLKALQRLEQNGKA